MKGIAIISNKGGVGKTTLGHLLALGAAWHLVPAYFIHTDEREPLEVKERPYGYIDARDPLIIEKFTNDFVDEEGICIFDGGGNRPDFDNWLASFVDLVLIPVVADKESIDIGKAIMGRLENSGFNNVRYLINMASSNHNSRQYDIKNFYNELESNKVLGEVKRVEAVKRLGLSDGNKTFQTPPSNVNNISRSMYGLIANYLDEKDHQSSNGRLCA